MNEFKIKNGFFSEGNSQITGSLIVTDGITGSLQGTASFATTASYALSALTASDSTSILSAITNNEDNYLLTATGTGTIEGESLLTFDGATLTAQSSFSQGGGGKANGQYSHAEGDKFTEANGNYSHAEGYTTFAGSFLGYLATPITAGSCSLDASYGDLSAEFSAGDQVLFDDTAYDADYGVQTFTVNSVTWDTTNTIVTLTDSTVNTTTASIGNITYGVANWTGGNQIGGHYSHAEGANTITLGPYSHAEGSGNYAFGAYSHAEGQGTQAFGAYSHAEGLDTQAIGRRSHAEGSFTTASGEASHAEGAQTLAFGSYSHAEGNGTQAIGAGSHAEGLYTTSSGNYSHAEGNSTRATGFASHAEGLYTSAQGNYSHAEGASTSAQGNYSHAEGYRTQAQGDASHAEGVDTQAIGNYSHAEGNSTQAIGVASHAEGLYTTASSGYSHAEGSASITFGNVSHTEGERTTTGFYGYISSITNGTASISSSYGDVTSIFTYWPGGGQVKELYIAPQGGGTYGTQRRTPAYGSNPPVYSGSNTIVYFDDPYLTTTAIIGFGNQNQPQAITLTPPIADRLIAGSSSHAEGYLTTAAGPYSHAEGSGNYAFGAYSHAEGLDTQAIGPSSHAEGHRTITKGIGTHAEGNATQAIGQYSHAEGFAAKSGFYGYISNGAVLSGVIILDFTYGDLTAYFTPGTNIIIQDSGAVPYGFSMIKSVASSIYTSSATYITLVDTSVNTIGGVYVGLYVEPGFSAYDQTPLSIPVIGQGSHAEGYRSQTIGNFSYTTGWETVALGTNQFVVGQGNSPVSTNSSFIIGNGTYSTGSGTWTNKSNLLVAGGNTVQITGSLRVTGSFVLPATSSGTPGYTGTQGEMVFGDNGAGSYRIFVWLGGAWRSGSLS